jgi:2-alkenal reductase
VGSTRSNESVERRSTAAGVAFALALVALVGSVALGGGFVNLSGPEPSTARAPAAQELATATPTVTTIAPEAPTAARAAPAADAPAEMDAVAVVERVAPAVVTVINLQRFEGPFGEESDDPLQAGSGTGFVIDDAGRIVTNQHVVAGGAEFEVIFWDGERRPATLIGQDPVSDLALVQVEGPLPATVPLGDSDALAVGQPVLAIGSPLGEFTNTVTQGIVSALNRTSEFFIGGPGQGVYTNLIQHDAAINPGNSGGPLINAAGEVIGVNTLGIPEGPSGPVQGLFFAVPSSTVREVVTQLIETGEVVYPWFGIRSRPFTRELAAQLDLDIDADYGALVLEVVPDEPADQAGIEVGDVILTVDGQRIDADNPFVEILFGHDPGETVEVVILRDDQEQTVQVTLGERPPDA